LAETGTARFVKGRWTMRSASVDFFAILRSPQSFEEPPQGQIERSILIFTVGLGPNNGSSPDEREFDAVTAHKALATVMATDGDVEFQWSIRKIGNLASFVIDIASESVCYLDVTSNNDEFHGGLPVPGVPPKHEGEVVHAVRYFTVVGAALSVT
jgi:hypothetical protein